MTRSLDDLGYTPDRYGLMERLLVHRIEQGGTLGFATGIQGCGKTTWLLRLALALMEQGEIVIMRGRHVDAWHKFPGDVKIWTDHPIQVLRAKLEGGGRAERWDVPIHQFSSVEDLLARLEPGCLNVVYAKDTEWKWVEKKVRGRDGASELVEVKTRFWDRLIHQLSRKLEAVWHALIIDESHEVWHDRPEGEDYVAQGKVRDDLADFRKTYNSCFLASHQPDEMDYRILAKFQFQMYGRGARPSSRSRVHPALTLSLSPGELILDSLHFATIRYPSLPIGDYQVFVRAIEDHDVEAREAYERAVEATLERALQRIEDKELVTLESSVTTPEGWHLWSCTCKTRRNIDRSETRFETIPCRPDRDCKVQRAIDDAARQRGMPIRFGASA